MFSIFCRISQHDKSWQILSSPVIEHFQPVHHFIGFSFVIVRRQVVNSTAQFFTCLIIINIGIIVTQIYFPIFETLPDCHWYWDHCNAKYIFHFHLKKGVEPVCITTSRCGANQQPIGIHFLKEKTHISWNRKKNLSWDKLFALQFCTTAPPFNLQWMLSIERMFGHLYFNPSFCFTFHRMLLYSFPPLTAPPLNVDHWKSVWPPEFQSKLQRQFPDWCPIGRNGLARWIPGLLGICEK